MKAQITTNVAGQQDDVEYNEFLKRVQLRFYNNVGLPLFTTDAEELFPAYLNALPEHERQHHTCNACRHFVERFGGLVTISTTGIATSAMWNVEDAPELYKASIEAMLKIIRRSKVTGVFLSSDSVWGQPVTGIWQHLSVRPQIVYKATALKNASQAMAEKKEDFKTMITALQEFKLEAVNQAVTLLKTDSLYRSEKCLGVAEWLLDLIKVRAEAKGKQARDNMLWLAVAIAPVGFCHPRSSMIGTLLEDIVKGLSFADVSRRFKEKMHPLSYQRPQVAPSVGNIAQAEKIVEQLGIKESLRRRFARLGEVQAIWTPMKAPEVIRGKSVFGHLIAQKVAENKTMQIPTLTMTWDKFQRAILPEAIEIEYYVPFHKDSFVALTTAANPEAPPILQWDLEEKRNPVSWYVYNNGSQASQWGLNQGWNKVNAVTLKPSMWNGGFEHQGEAVIFLINGAKDSRTDSGIALFPETLKSELREIRSTIEQFSKLGKFEEFDGEAAAGVVAAKGSNWNIRLKVRTASGTVEYKLDRWD